MCDWAFEVHRPHPCSGGWCILVVGSRVWAWGPFSTLQDAHQAEHHIFQRWNRAARDRGGWAWKTTSKRWVITAPDGVAVDGAPFERVACSRHQT